MNNLAFERLKGRENFTEWKTGAKAFLTAKGLGIHITNPLSTSANATETANNQKALAELILLLEPSIYSYVEGINEAKTAWDALVNNFEDKGAVRKVALLKQWTTLSSSGCASLHEYVNKSVALRTKVKTAGFDISEEIAGCILLGGLSDEYKPLIMSIEAGKDTLSLDFVKNILLQSVDYEIGESALIAKNKYKKKSKKPVKCYGCGGPHYRSKCPNSKKTEQSECVLYSALATNENINDEWFIDSGATKHMTHVNHDFMNKRKPIISEVKVADNSKVKIDHVGEFNCVFDDKLKNSVTLTEVQYIPNLCVNLLSVSQIVKRKYTVVFDINGCKILNENGDLMAEGKLINDMFRIKIKTSESACSVKKCDDSFLWHRRLAHCNFNTLKKVLNIPIKGELKCDTCAQGKHARSPFSEKGDRANKLLELIHSDVCGPFSVRSLSGAVYYVSFIDDYSKKVFIFPLKSKGQVFSKFVEFKTRVENETEAKIKILRTDNGTEYINKNFEAFCAKYGIIHQKSAPYSPQQNGVAERYNRTIVEKIRCLLFDAKLSKQFWSEAACAAVDIINMLPTASNQMSPNEIWNKKYDINLLKVFGCKAMVWQPTQKRTKLDPKSYECIYLGFAHDTKAYRLYNMNTKKIVISRDVIFFENNDAVINTNNLNKISKNFIQNSAVESDAEDIIEEDTSSDDDVEAIVSGGNDQVQTTTSKSNDVNDGNFSDADESASGNDTVTVNESASTLEQSNVDDGTVDNTDSDPDFSTRARIDQNAERPRTRSVVSSFRNILNYHMAFSVNEPSSYKEALRGEKCGEWKKAMKEEIEALTKNNTWILVDRPINENVVDNRWVYKIKNEQRGQPMRFKARLVARGFTQEYGVDYCETFSPVVRFTSIRMILSIAAQRKMHIKQFDVKTAFLNGELRETVYMEQPLGFKDATNRVCLLKKSLYGLKQASRCWNQKFSSFIKLFGFKQCKLDPCVYFSNKDDKLMILAIHVDDGLIIGESSEEIHSVIKHLNTNFEVKEMEVGCFLGLEIEQKTDGSIFIHQSIYAKRVLSRFNMENCNSVSTPSDPNQILHSFEESDVAKYPYRELIGSLMYLSIGTRPDITHAVGMASRFMEAPKIAHVEAAKRILKYLNKTFNFGILYLNSKHDELLAYSDSDYAGDIDSRRSTSGYAFIFGSGIVSWCSERQKSVSLSTTESEYIAASICVRELVWIGNLLCEILSLKNLKTTLYMDNQSAIRLIKNPEFHKRSKHIDVRYHFIREKYDDKLFFLNYISTENMLADIFTKPLPAQKFNFLVAKLGVTSV